jgi:phosphohistidine phosphatase
MPDIYLLRHGIAVSHGTPDIPDDERPLTPEGEKRMRQVARGLKRLDLKLDRIVTSPLPRALKTAQIVAEVLGMEDLLETNDALRAGRDASSIRDWVHTRPEQSLMLVGHNPAFNELVGLLVTGEPGVPICELHKGGIAALSSGPDGGLKLDWLARPRLFRQLADN